MQQQSIAVFRNHYLSSDTTPVVMAATVTSEALQVFGNQVNLSVMVINTSASVSSLTFSLEGSIDGNAWVNIDDLVKSDFGYAQIASVASAFAYPFVRVKAVIVAGDALFDVTLGFSDQ